MRPPISRKWELSHSARCVLLVDTGVTFSEAWSCAASKPLDTRKVSLTAVILGGRTVHPSQQLTPDLTAALSRGEAKGLVFCPLHASTDVVTPGITLPLSRLLVKFEYSVYFVFLILKKENRRQDRVRFADSLLERERKL